MKIEPGTLCYLIKADPGHEHLLGRIVEVIAPALPIPERGGVLMHRIDAPWLRSGWPRFHCFAAPAQLRPITPPGTERCTRELAQA